MRLVQLRYATKHLLETVVGSWVFILLFRRPLLCLLNDLFYKGEKVRHRHEVFVVSTGVIYKLLMLSIFAPFSYINLRAEPLDKIFSTDTLLSGTGVCRATFSSEASLELCRVGKQKGFYTRVNTSTLGTFAALHADNIDGVDPLEQDKKIPAPISEGYLWDFAEVCRGSGILTEAHRRLGMVVHPGFEVHDGNTGNILNSATFLAIIGLIYRRVIRSWHLGMECTTFGTLRRPRLRSKTQPFGFDPSEVHICCGNRLAICGAFLIHLCIDFGLLVSCKQSGGSVMYYLDIYQKLLQKGMDLLRFTFCNWGTPFQKQSWWLSNNPKLLSLRDVCRCGHFGRYFRVQGCFNRARLAEFESLCRPAVLQVFGRRPALGKHVTSFFGRYPIILCNRIAKINKKFWDESVAPADLQRPVSTPAPWVGQRSRSLKWKKLLQYPIAKLNYINVNEQLAYRSLFKNLSKERAHSRFYLLLDSRVIIGYNAKGRLSSKQLNFYLGTTLPYVIGGDLYPCYIYVGFTDNASDNILRFMKLRNQDTEPPSWLAYLLHGNPSLFDAVRETDKLVWPLSGWSRLLRVL